MAKLKERVKSEKIQQQKTWMQGGQTDSRDMYDCIPLKSVSEIFSNLDKTSHSGSIELYLRRNSTVDTTQNATPKKKESPKEQLKKFIPVLRKVV